MPDPTDEEIIDALVRGQVNPDVDALVDELVSEGAG